MSATLTCGSCGEPLAAGSTWNLWRCANRACPRYGRQLELKPTQRAFFRRVNHFAKKRA